MSVSKNSRGKKAFMVRALELAARARGLTSPNPMVGAVIVQSGRVVGEGYHAQAGEKHAEVKALTAAGAKARGADLYITLEPCSHFGRTPPCTQALIAAGIGRVFVAMRDPNPKVAGDGINQLRRAGLSVRTGLMEKEALRLNEIYVKFMTTSLPFVLLKTGMSLNGKIATKSRESRWITNAMAREKVHELRGKVDAVMVGIGTVLADDPALTTRLSGKERNNPVRVIIDAALRIPEGAKVLSRLNSPQTIIVTTGSAPEDKVRRVRDLGAEVMILENAGSRIDFRTLVEELGKRGLTSLLIEGGGEVAASALAAGIVDKVIFFIAPKIIGGREAPTAVSGAGVNSLRQALQIQEVTYSILGDNFMVEGYLYHPEE